MFETWAPAGDAVLGGGGNFRRWSQAGESRFLVCWVLKFITGLPISWRWEVLAPLSHHDGIFYCHTFPAVAD